jgi:hypothetical protein
MEGAEMKVTVKDHLGSHNDPVVFEGTAMEVEHALRKYFTGVIGHIPFGGLYEILRTLKHMGGMECIVEGPIPGPLPRRAKARHRQVDPWLHEIDLPIGDEKENL